MDTKRIDGMQLKRIELSIMQEIHSICQKEGFRYSLCGGSLLGAIRHGGFIPWDDDIDIFMPRPDYEAFIDYCMKNPVPFKILCNKSDKNYTYLFAKAVDPNTVLIENNCEMKAVDLGVYVDVFPLDGLGNSYEEAMKKFNESSFMRELLVAVNWKKYFRSKTRRWYYEPVRFVFYLISRLISGEKLIKKIEKKYDFQCFDHVEYVACICGSYRAKEVGPRRLFQEYTDVKFEDCSFKGLKDYDQYLKNIYGNYMQLPPKEKQVSHHSFEAFYK